MGPFRWFPFARAGGAFNMAADEVLAYMAADRGIASLRFYGWSDPTLSLGYFEPSEDRHTSERLAALPWVRRPSGGKALVHDRELTYAMALPAGFARGWMARMHKRVILPALASFGLSGSLQVATESRLLGDVLCFEHQTPGDLLCSGKKVVGSAQRKYRQSLLQHGAILLAQCEHAPELPGISELSDMDLPVEALQQAVLGAFRLETGWSGHEAAWSEEEEIAIRELVASQFGSPTWNAKR